MEKKKSRKKWSDFPRWQRWAGIAIILLVIYAVSGFWVLPAVVKSQLETRLSQILHRQTTIEKIKFNPFSLQSEVSQFKINDPSGKEAFVRFDSLKLNLQWRSLFRFAVIVKSVSLVNPFVHLALNPDKTWNFSDLLGAEGDDRSDGKSAAKGSGDSKNVLFSINNIEISDGEILFNDHIKNIPHTIKGIRLALPYLSTLPSDIEIFVQPAFNAVINDIPIGMQGDSKPFHESRHSQLDITFKDIDLTTYLAYLPENIGVEVRNGTLDLSLGFDFKNQAGGRPAVQVHGNMGLRQVDIRDQKDRKVLGVPEFILDIENMDILKKEFHLSRVLLKEPFMDIGRMPDGQLNWSTFFRGDKKAENTAPDAQGNPDPVSDKGSPFLVKVKEIVVDQAHIDFVDQAVPTPFTTTLTPFSIKVENFTTAPDQSSDFSVVFTSERSEKISAKGHFSVQPFEINTALDLSDIKIDKYRPYYQGVLTADLAADTVGLKADIDFSPESQVLKVSNAGIEIQNLSLSNSSEKEKITIPYLGVTNTDVDINKQTVSIDTIQSKDAVIPIFRRSDGRINVQEFFAISKNDEIQEISGNNQEISRDNTDKKEEAAAWQVMVQTIDLSNYETVFTDQVPASPAVFQFDSMNLDISGFSTLPDETGNVTFDVQLNKTADIKASGKMGVSPLTLDLDLGIKELPIKAAQPYMDGKINAMIASGNSNVSGKLSLTQKDKDFPVNFRGTVSSHNFSLLDTKAKKLISWQKLAFKALDVTSSPLSLEMEELAVDGFKSTVAIDEQGVVNLATLVNKDKTSSDRDQTAEKKEKEQTSETAAHIEIKQVSIADNAVEFTDAQVSPTFKASLQDIKGKVTGLSSGKDVLADIDISASLNKYSPVSVTGTIHPWQDFYTDFQVDIRDIELSHMSPYTVKFIGYPLTKGKLGLDLHYQIKDKALSSENKAFIDQIALGDFVKNDTATSLPVPLAIALLKNRAGEIKLDIPVSGRLDDPKFSIGGVIFTVITNLLVKAATSPFALLGAVLPENRDFLFSEFEPGLSQVVNQDEEEWTAFVKAMYDHPSVKLDITGFVHPDQDTKAMIQNNFDRQIKAQKLKDMLKKDETAVELDQVVIAPEEYEKYLKKAYKAAEFKKPKNLVGLQKRLPLEEMEKLIYDHIVISDEDLHQLGMERATAVKNALVEQGPIDPERIFILQPKHSSPEDKVPALRAEIVAK